MSVFLTVGAATDHRPGRYHWRAPWRPMAGARGSACGDRRLAYETGRDPASIPTDRRCRARGCVERWGAVDQPDDLMTSAEEAKT